LLIINRKLSESLVIGDNLLITVLDIQGTRIQLRLGLLEEKSILSVCTIKLDERLKVGNDLTITVVQIRGKQAKIGIDSHRDIQILRGELYNKDRDAY
jgi:carbon storage regulator